MLQNMCEYCVRILEEEKHRQLRMFVNLWKKWKKLESKRIDKLKRVMPKTVRTSENIAAEAESVYEKTSTSIHHRPQQLNILETSLRRIWHKDFGMTQYKVQLAKELKPIDHTLCFRFVRWRFFKKVIFLDEAHFDLGGYGNKQNCGIWDTENPHVHNEKPTHPKQVNVWCGFWSRGILGKFFFEDE